MKTTTKRLCLTLLLLNFISSEIIFKIEGGITLSIDSDNHFIMEKADDNGIPSTITKMHVEKGDGNEPETLDQLEVWFALDSAATSRVIKELKDAKTPKEKSIANKNRRAGITSLLNANRKLKEVKGEP
jgi:hypothetical protein